MAKFTEDQTWLEQNKKYSILAYQGYCYILFCMSLHVTLISVLTRLYLSPNFYRLHFSVLSHHLFTQLAGMICIFAFQLSLPCQNKVSIWQAFKQLRSPSRLFRTSHVQVHVPFVSATSRLHFPLSMRQIITKLFMSPGFLPGKKTSRLREIQEMVKEFPAKTLCQQGKVILSLFRSCSLQVQEFDRNNG